MRFQLAPRPHHNVLGRGVLNQIVKGLMVQNIHDLLADYALDRVEVFNHPTGRPIGLNRAAYGHFQTIGMTVHAGTLAGVVWKYVSRFKAEVLANLHVETARAFRARTKGVR